jgi:hypothetical protein
MGSSIGKGGGHQNLREEAMKQTKKAIYIYILTQKNNVI